MYVCTAFVFLYHFCNRVVHLVQLGVFCHGFIKFEFFFVILNFFWEQILIVTFWHFFALLYVLFESFLWHVTSSCTVFYKLCLICAHINIICIICMLACGLSMHVCIVSCGCIQYELVLRTSMFCLLSIVCMYEMHAFYLT